MHTFQTSRQKFFLRIFLDDFIFYLGYSSIILTLDTYSHLVPDIQKEAVNALDSLGI